MIIYDYRDTRFKTINDPYIVVYSSQKEVNNYRHYGFDLTFLSDKNP